MTVKHLRETVRRTILLSLMLIVSWGTSAYALTDIWDGSTATAFAGGTGTASDPYLISTGAQLKLLASKVTTYKQKYFRQINDIDLNHISGLRIGLAQNTASHTDFVGVYDGDGYKISNYYWNESSNPAHANSVGLFGVIGGDGSFTTIVKNLEIVDAEIAMNFSAGNLQTQSYRAGIAVGTSLKNSWVQNIIVHSSKIHDGGCTNAYTGNGSGIFLGGIVGSAETEYNNQTAGTTTYIENCYAQCDIDVHNLTVASTIGTTTQNTGLFQFNVGGIVGRIRSQTVNYPKNCQYSGGLLYAPYAFVGPIIGVIRSGSPTWAADIWGYSKWAMGRPNAINTYYLPTENSDTYFFNEWKLGWSPYHYVKSPVSDLAGAVNSITAMYPDHVDYENHTVIVDDISPRRPTMAGNTYTNRVPLINNTPANINMALDTAHMALVQGINFGTYTTETKSDLFNTYATANGLSSWYTRNGSATFAPITLDLSVSAGDPELFEVTITDGAKEDVIYSYRWYVDGVYKEVNHTGEFGLELKRAAQYISVEVFDASNMTHVLASAGISVAIDLKLNVIDIDDSTVRVEWSGTNADLWAGNFDYVWTDYATGAVLGRGMTFGGLKSPNSYLCTATHKIHTDLTYTVIKSLAGVIYVNYSGYVTASGDTLRGDNANFGATPELAVKTLKRAYELLPDTSRVSTNMIVIMGDYKENAFAYRTNVTESKDVDGPTGTPTDWLTAEQWANKDVTISGRFGSADYQGRIYMQNESHMIWANTMFRYLTIYGLNSSSGNMFMYAQGNDLTFDLGINLAQYKFSGVTERGQIKGSDICEVSLFGGYLDWNKDISPNVEDRINNLTVRSGKWGRILAGGRNTKDGEPGIAGTYDHPLRCHVVIDIDNSDNPQSTSPDYEVGLVCGGQTDGSSWAVNDVNVYRGTYGRIVAGTIGFGRFGKGQDGTPRPAESYFGSATVNIYDGATVKELYGSSLGRIVSSVQGRGNYYADSCAVYYYGLSTLNLYGGVIDGNIYGAGAGSTSGLAGGTGDLFEHNGDRRCPSWNGTEVRYLSYDEIMSGNYTALVMTRNDSTAFRLDTTVCTVNIRGGKVTGNVYGGGYGYSDMVTITGATTEMGNLYGDAHVNISGGVISKNVYGGGAGTTRILEEVAKDSATLNPKNKDYSMLARLLGNTYVTLTGGTVEGDVYGAGMGIATSSSSSSSAFPFMAEMNGETHVLLDGGYAAAVLFGGGQYASVNGDTYVRTLSGQIGTSVFGGGRGDELTDAAVFGATHVDIDGAEFYPLVDMGTNYKGYSVHGGGHTHCTVLNTYVNVTKSLITQEIMTYLDWKNLTEKSWNPKFCTVGGGYGAQTEVWEDTHVTIDINFVGDQKIDLPLVMSNNIALPRQSMLDVMGGGLYGIVGGSTYVTVKGNSCIRSVYGGGLAGNVGTFDEYQNGNEYVMSDTLRHYRSSSNVTILSGAINNVFGGGFLADVCGETNVTIGSLDNPAANDSIFIHHVFGGSDVTGRIAGNNNPNHGTHINIYGGTILSDVYGAGNGYYNNYNAPLPPDSLVLAELKGAYVGKSRPHVASTEINIGGADADHPVQIIGAVYGGGMACAVSCYDSTSVDQWNKRERPIANSGRIWFNIADNVRIGKLFMGANGIMNDTVTNLPMHEYTLDGGVTWKNGFYNHEGVRDYYKLAHTDAVPRLTFNANRSFDTNDMDARNIRIGSFYGGANHGMMGSTHPYEYTLPDGVTITEKVVGGCNDVQFSYHVEQGIPTYDKDSNIIKTTYDSTYIAGFIQVNEPAYADQPKIKLNLFCNFELQDKSTDADPTYFTGGMVYGGCYKTGIIIGDVEVNLHSDVTGGLVDYRSSVVQTIANLWKHDFGQVFGGGYGAKSEVVGNTYVNICHGRLNGKDYYPQAIHVFGGGDEGDVAGSTHVTYDGVGLESYIFGCLYGGGRHGDIVQHSILRAAVDTLDGDGNTNVLVKSGHVNTVFGGACDAKIEGGTYIEVTDGTGPYRTIVNKVYGGTDISGAIMGLRTYPNPHKEHLLESNDAGDLTDEPDSISVNAYVKISEIPGGEYKSGRGGYSGFPLIATVFAGGNGDYGVHLPNETYGDDHLTDSGQDLVGKSLPNIEAVYLDIQGGTIWQAFGGGNNAKISKYSGLHLDNDNGVCASFSDPATYQMAKGIINANLEMWNGYVDDGSSIRVLRNVWRLYGGNNRADCDIQPDWYLDKGHIGSLYSGGNAGRMTYYNPNADSTGTPGISVTVNSDSIYIDNVFGGCCMADVAALSQRAIYYNAESIADEIPAHFGKDQYGATVNILAGQIETVYGGNDVSGNVNNGTHVYIAGAISGNVYGAGNGDYLYRNSNSVLTVTENSDLTYGEHFFDVPMRLAYLNNTEKINNINEWRPNVDKAYLQIEGRDADHVAYVKGQIFCGGNSSTVLGDSSTVRFEVGNHVTINEIFLGSDGINLIDGNKVEDFKVLNDINSLAEANANIYDRKHYPTLLDVYMRAVESTALPESFNFRQQYENAYIGIFCCGGNAGSMVTNEDVDITFPESLILFRDIIAGCKNTNFTYDGAKHVGGFITPVESDTRPTTRLTVKSIFKPLCMDLEKGKRENHYLLENIEESTGAYYTTNDIFGGCYTSGNMERNVEINLYSNLIKNTDSTALAKTIAMSRRAFSVYGGGLGTDTYTLGNVEINMLASNSVSGTMQISDPDSTITVPAVNNIFCGGAQGNVWGNTLVRIKAGEVKTYVFGGSNSGFVRGSTAILIGYPKYYVCQTTGEYLLKRGDEAADNLALLNKTGSDDAGSEVIKQRVKYAEGDIVPTNVYQQIVAYDSLHSTEQHKQFGFVQEIYPTEWSNIKVGRGVYGGGFSTALGSANIFAGAYTITKRTADRTEDPALVGYGGNTTIVVQDNPLVTTHDYIRISTESHKVAHLKPGEDKLGYYVREVKDGVETGRYTHQSTGTVQAGDPTYYTFEGEGGIFGDGHLVFAEGFRAAEINDYGYDEGTPQYPILINTFQRLDLISCNDCCMQLQGERDFATNAVDATTYSIARIDELQLNSSIDDTKDLIASNIDTLDKVHSRNFLGFFNNVHYLGALVSNVAFDDATAHPHHNEVGVTRGQSYMAYKKGYIDAYYGVTDHTQDANFKRRNLGTAKNMIGINNGYCLKIQNAYTDYNNSNKLVEDHLYYGPIMGVIEVKLLTLISGEGGGYIYADNLHEDSRNFLETKGNFIFPAGVANNDQKQFIVDDCFPMGYDLTKDDATGLPGDSIHYWYVEGNLYFYHANITGYTYNSVENPLKFNLNNIDNIITLAGTAEGQTIYLDTIKWQSGHDETFECDIENPDKAYTLQISASDNYLYNEAGCYDVLPRESQYATQTLKGTASKNHPILGLCLTDAVDNSGEDYFLQHMQEPEMAELRMHSYDAGGNRYNYVVNLRIDYMQGPSIKGNIKIDHCVLPGEIIHVSHDDVIITTDANMPVTNISWYLLPKTGENEWANYEQGINVTKYRNDNGDLLLPARYYQNDWRVQYLVQTSNYFFPVDAPEGDHLRIHNYHSMKKVCSIDGNGNIQPQLDVAAGARIYIEDLTDLDRFRRFIDYSTEAHQINDTVLYVDKDDPTNDHQMIYELYPANCEGLKFYIQSDLIQTNAWTTPTNAFKGELNGDGHVIELNQAATTGAFIGINEGSIYNLGTHNVHPMVSTNNGMIVNSFSYGADLAGDYAGGKMLNCYQNANTAQTATYANDTDFGNGRVAYNLNQFYLAKRQVLAGDTDTPGDTANVAYKYLYDYYANGDYRYARITTDGSEYLRTKRIPNYDGLDGTYNTYHLVSHDLDKSRATGYAKSDADKVNLIYFSSVGDTAQFVEDHYEPIYPTDYMFFGQTLTYKASTHQEHPYHLDVAKKDNRVYRVSGYYGSKEDKGAHFNHAAAFNDDDLTAIDFTCQRDNGTYTIGTVTRNGSNGKAEQSVFYAPAADYDGITTFGLTNTDITQNLLVYTAASDDTTGAYTAVKKTLSYTQSTAESAIKGHQINYDGTDTNSALNGLLHLIDKEDFNAPLPFEATTRAWYVRQPEAYDAEGYTTYNLANGAGDGWESLCLPFTVKRVIAAQTDNVSGQNQYNHGEITHFYDTESDLTNVGNADHNQVGHEYWLRGLTGYDATTGLNFMRPTTSAATGFYDARITAQKFDYAFVNNYLAGVTNESNIYSYYDIAHTYEGYLPITAAIPYIVAYPGRYFYEFDMTGETMTYDHAATATAPAMVAVSDDETQSTTAGGKQYVGSYMHHTLGAADYVLNDAPYTVDAATYAPGTLFCRQESQTTTLPFRAYLTTAGAQSKPYYRIAGSRNSDEEADDEEADDRLGSSYLNLYVSDMTLVVVSSEARTLDLYNADGVLVSHLSIKQGTNKFPLKQKGVYVAGSKKLIAL